jgi:ADP-ribose pyrophosphatase YjhB (NUDIX family)
VSRYARFCLRCGSRLERLLPPSCPTCRWTYYDNPRPTVAAIVVRNGRLLLTRRALPPLAGTWDLPGGFLQGTETPEAGLRRELLEELGMHVRQVKAIGFLTDRYGRDRLPLLNIVFRVTPEPGSLRPADDVSELRWFPRNAVPLRAIGFPAMRQAVRLFVS